LRLTISDSNGKPFSNRNRYSDANR
jgi:hypothetical protein